VDISKKLKHEGKIQNFYRLHLNRRTNLCCVSLKTLKANYTRSAWYSKIPKHWCNLAKCEVKMFRHSNRGYIALQFNCEHNPGIALIDTGSGYVLHGGTQSLQSFMFSPDKNTIGCGATNATNKLSIINNNI